MKPLCRGGMDDLFRDADIRILSEAPASALTRRFFLRDPAQTAWVADSAVDEHEMVIRFPCLPHSLTPVAPEKVFGLEASFHGSDCVVAWVSVPQKYRRRTLGRWMVRQVAHECARRGIRWISGTIEPNDEALPFWISFSPALARNGRPVSSLNARQQRGVRFRIDTTRLLMMQITTQTLSEKEFKKCITPSADPSE